MTPRERGSLRPVGLVGMAWGTVLLWRGTHVFRSLEGRAPTSGEQDAIAVLGLRHAAQGLAQVVAPHHFGRLYATVDVLHAASMVVLAAAASTRRRATLVSGGVAALAGLASARAARW